MTKYIRDGRSPVPKSENTSKVMSANKGKDTGPELLLRKGLWIEGVRGYRLHCKDIPGRPDLCFRKQKLAIFVHGCFWHRCPYCNLAIPKSNSGFWESKFEVNVNRDLRKLEALTNAGFNVLVFWECEIKSNTSKCVMEIKIKLHKK